MAPLLIPIGTALGASAGTAALTGALAVGTGVAVAGGLQQGRAAEAQAKSQQNIANFGAELKKREAEAERQRRIFNQKRIAREGAEASSALAASISAEGGGASPAGTEILVSQKKKTELDVLLEGFEGASKAKALEQEAQLLALGGKSAMKHGKNLKRASYFGAGSTLLTGFGEAGLFD